MRVCVVLLASWLCWTSQALLVPLRPSPRTGARCLRAAVEELPLPPGKLGLPLLGDKTFPFTKTGSQYLEVRFPENSSVSVHLVLPARPPISSAVKYTLVHSPAGRPISFGRKIVPTPSS